MTAAMAGSVLFAALPAATATAAPAAGQQNVAARAGSIRVNIPQLRQQSADLKAKANRLDRDGAHAEAKRARAEAAAIDRRIQAYLDAEENM
ncbi:hypothetical protein [Streptomyces sp. H27-C3]|uniref:hypothetical protein n=1 Tax=Streptomyces sp. H27-C3 TaxID=3046305 RepID=UPI0024BA2283|nr:hypothetical protein [Streptomyces sp. H27-C3]MDJ0465134.1 hypothetical protein [Streptomyces sp. H27-C3]